MSDAILATQWILFGVCMFFAVRQIFRWGVPESEAAEGNQERLQALRKSQADLTFVAMLVISGGCWVVGKVLRFIFAI